MNKFLLLMLLPLTMWGCGGKGTPDPTPDPEPEPVVATESVTGSFLQHWYAKGWTESRWNQEMQVLKDAGMEYLIYSPIKEDDEAPDYASLEKCLKTAASHGIKVFVGCNAHDDWWDTSITSARLNALMQEGLTIAQEAYRRFHATYAKSFYGWYWDWEVDNVNWGSRKQMLADAWNITLDGVTALDSSMPLLFSPFMNPSSGTAAQYRDFWKSLFPLLHLRKGDVFAPQDCVGARGLDPTKVKPWFSNLADAAKTVDGLQFWANIELFDQYTLSGEDYFATASMTRMAQQKEAVKSFVSRIICFSYTHYYSPHVVREDYHTAYQAYLKDGSLPTPGKPGKVNTATKEVGTGVALHWSIVTKTDVDGFALYKNGKVFVKLQVTQEDTFPDYFFDYEGKSSDSYQITTYNIVGNESPKVSF